MKRLIVAFAGVVVSGCVSNGGVLGNADSLKERVSEYAFRENPGLNRSTQFDIENYQVEGLEEELHLGLYRVIYRSSDAVPFNERYFVVDNKTLTPLASSFGGHGLMSAAVDNGALYYSYSFGSGIHRSHIGRLSIDGDDVHIVETGGYSATNLFVSKGSDGIEVESGLFSGFNLWESSEVVGTVKHEPSSLVIIDAVGAEIPPMFPAIRH